MLGIVAFRHNSFATIAILSNTAFKFSVTSESQKRRTAISFRRQPSIASLVARETNREIVLAAVELDRKATLRAIEIEQISSNWRLPAETMAVDLAVA